MVTGKLGKTTQSGGDEPEFKPLVLAVFAAIALAGAAFHANRHSPLTMASESALVAHRLWSLLFEKQ